MSLEELLRRIARKGSWMGGGSVAALCAALSAALLEKLVVQPAAAQRLRRIRRACLALIPRDARAFSHVIQATRHSDRRGFARALKRAT
ncbi:MAG: cyclodeaminase/cyclohydrolase family protein, partial [Candidatus Omnitrophica bacterium]|nr:cyclodeaminase/cyclohydrolase family protein [Candidatus Omnitrophota bacterium]